MPAFLPCRPGQGKQAHGSPQQTARPHVAHGARGAHDVAEVRAARGCTAAPTLRIIVTDAQVRRASRAAFIAWHHMLRPWRRYAAYLLAGSAVAWALQDVTVTVMIPVAVLGDVYLHFRKTVEDTRTQEPVGTAISIGFGDEAFAYRTWVQSGEVPYTAVQKVVASTGCLVIVALSERIFWALPEEQVPPEALMRMSPKLAEKQRSPRR